MLQRLTAWLRDPQVRGFLISTAVLAAVSLAFFYPDSFEGNSLQQSDIRQGLANGHEAALWQDETGHKPLWTNSLFGGMPTFQISPTYPSNDLFRWIDSVYGLGLPAPSNLMFMMMAGFLILLFTMRLRWYYALLGALAWGLSTYFVIIIGAGHIWKFITLAYIPPTIAGLMLVYRGRYVSGGAVLALFAMMQLNANHPQMSYYFAFVMAALVLAWLAEAVRAGQLRRWATATAVTLAAGLLALGANLPSIYNTYEYARHTKRTTSELTPLTPAEAASDAPRPTGGMPYDQIVGWSYGPSESFSLLIPDIKGGASARPEGGRMEFLGLDKLPQAAAMEGTPQASMLPYLSQYFNDSEGTNGPVYAGALVFALFLLGCAVVRGPVKWALLAVTVLSLLLALGRNFAALTDLMIYNFPLYNKFRAVESILVIAEFTMPLLAVMGLHKLLTSGEPLRRHGRALAWSFGIPAAVCLAAALWPQLFGEAVTAADRSVAEGIARQVGEMARQYGMDRAQTDAALWQYSLANPANLSAIESLRYGMVRADAWRSLLFIALGAAAVWLGCRRSLRPAAAVTALAVLVVADLYPVDKRYVSHSSFAPAGAGADAAPFTPDAADNAILADTALHYRVLDIPGFDLPDRSYFHRTIGGYHAAKLIRYEDLIQRRLRPLNALGYYPELRDDSVAAQYPEAVRDAAAAYRVLDMLNTRYIITGDTGVPLLLNDRALGNAWLVPSLTWVDGADAEMAALHTLRPATEAVADRRFAPALGTSAPSLCPGDTVWLTSYAPDRLTYRTVTSADSALAVFSEVWFPWGWKADIDGKPAPLGRVNYLLRALRLPAGEHTVTMTFDPDSIRVTSAVAYACVTLIYLLCLAGLFIRSRRCQPCN